MHPFIRTVCFSTLLAVAACTQEPAVHAKIETAESESIRFDVAFVTHLDMDMAEQDVYIEHEKGSGEVYRVTKGDNDMNAPLYATAEEVPHNPFDATTNGPHKKGRPLGLFCRRQRFPLGWTAIGKHY